MDKASISTALKYLHIIGFDPLRSNNLFSKIRQFVSYLVFILTVFSSLLELFLHCNNFAVIVRASEIVFPYYMIFWKFVVLKRHKNKLANLIRQSEQFWALDALGDKYKFENQKYHTIVKKCFMFYLGIVAFSCSQYILGAIFTEKPMLLSFGETKGLSLKIRMCYLMQHTVYLIVILNCVFGFDCLFFYLVAHILTELKMVKVAFSKKQISPPWNYKKRFRMALQHHKFILNYVQIVNSVYSSMLLQQHFVVLCGICFGSYLLIENGVPPDYQHLAKYTPYVFGFMFQGWMYSFAGDLIIHWSVEISDQVFDENWSLNRAYQQKLDKLIIIARAQRPARISLGGFHNLDLRSFTLVLKNSMSFFTFMNAVTVNAK